MLKQAVQQGRSEGRPAAYPLGYVEDRHDARMPLADLFSILLVINISGERKWGQAKLARRSWR